METSVQTADSMEPELDGPIYGVTYSCALTNVLVGLFFGAEEQVFCSCHFFFKRHIRRAVRAMSTNKAVDKEGL